MLKMGVFGSRNLLKMSVFGSRNLTEVETKKVLDALELIWNKLDLYNRPYVILHGGAKGVQNVVVNSALVREDDNTILFQPWTQIDKKIKFVPKMFEFRNQQILDNSNLVIIMTNGTKDSEVDRVLNYCEEHDIERVLVHIKE